MMTSTSCVGGFGLQSTLLKGAGFTALRCIACWMVIIAHGSFLATGVSAQRLTLVEMNCENLFDTRHDSLKQDSEYLPTASRYWTPKRYWRKINNIAQSLLSTTDDAVPDLVALCEVENDTVLRDLTQRSLLRGAGYDYQITCSPDLRGIDVALLYQPLSFQPLLWHELRVKPVKNMRPTRDILYVCGLVSSGDTLHVFVVHAPSRFGGERYSRPFRQAVANCLLTAVDSIYRVSQDARILIAGDFNDYAGSAVLQTFRRHRLHNLTANALGTNGVKGTYRYNGQWESIDHVFGSRSIYHMVDTAFIHAPMFLLEEESMYGGLRPRRTYNGMRYQPGYSDHLPLVVRIKWRRRH